MRRNHGQTRRKISSIMAVGTLLAILGVSMAIQMLPTARAATTWQVSVNSDFFSPKTLNIQVGDTVVWTSTVTAAHTVTSDTGAWTQINFNVPGDNGSHTFMSPGTYNYHCIYHVSVGMVGTIQVGGAVPEFSSSLVVVTSMMALFLGLFILRGRRSKE